MLSFTTKETADARETIEARIIDAVMENVEITALMIEVKSLYVNNYITESDFSFLTDLEMIKEIYC